MKVRRSDVQHVVQIPFVARDKSVNYRHFLVHSKGPFTLNETRSNAKTTIFLAVYIKKNSLMTEKLIAFAKDSFCSYVAFPTPFCLCE